MRKIISLTLASCILLSGCNTTGNSINKITEELANYSYMDATIKGKAVLDVPETLVVSQGEADLLNKAKYVTYHIEEKSTPDVTFIDADISFTNSDLTFQSYSDEKESLMSNGKGWYHFEENPLPLDLKLKSLHKFIRDAMKNSNTYKVSKSRPKIIFNDKEYKTTSYELVFNQEYLKVLSMDLGVKVQTLKLRFFIHRGKLLVTQYDTEFKKNTANGDFIAMGLSGEILFNSINSSETAAPKPTVLKVYTTPADFFIETLLEE